MMNTNKIKISTNYQIIILVLLSFGLNINTLFNQYALDDEVVLTENRFVAKGIKGIPDILSTDYVYGYSIKENILTGARYRPLSLILFALEHQFFGTNPFVSHLINILLFTLLVVLLFKLLRTHILKDQNPYLSFVTCLLFAAHPIHTEIIANVKSRDEIITFIFLILSLAGIIKYIKLGRVWLLSSSLLCFFLALLTKETAVTFIGVVPLILYFFYDQPVKKIILYCIPFLVAFAGYMLIRYLIVGFKYYPVNDITNAPFLYATASEAFATKTFILFKYVWLLLFPHPLTSDYGYNQIPYIELTSIKFIFSALLVAGMTAYSLFFLKNTSLLSFCILYFFTTISVGTNFIIDLGTPMAERMLFQPSLAFCIAAAFLFLKFNNSRKMLSAICLLTILILFSIKTVARNSDWKNNETLFFADINSSPNSARVNLYTCEQYIKKALGQENENLKHEYLTKAVYYGERSLKIHPKFAYSYVRLGYAYTFLQDYLKAADMWKIVYRMEPTDPEAKKMSSDVSDFLYKKGNGFFEQGNINEAIKYYQKSIELNPSNVESWYNLGGSYLIQHNDSMLTLAWKEVKKLNPNHAFRKEDFIIR